MKTTSLLSAVLASSAGIVTASSLEYKDGTIICPKNLPNGAFCSGNSLETDIIIRCNNGIAQPGRCGNNLAGQPPNTGNTNIARCWESSSNSGIAACEKNCIVYGSSGTYNGTFTLPDCQPWYTPLPSPTSSTSTSRPTTSSTSIEDCETTTTSYSTKTHNTKPPHTTTTTTSTEDCETISTTSYSSTKTDHTKPPHTKTTTTTADCEDTTESYTRTHHTKPPHSFTTSKHYNTTVTYTHTRPPHSTGTGYTTTTETTVVVPTTVITSSTSRVPVGPSTTSTAVPGGAMGRGMGGDSLAALVLGFGVVGLMF